MFINKKMAKRNPAVIVAVIGAVALIIAAIVGALLQPSWWRSESSATTTILTIAGTVVEESTNRAIGQARISVVGRGESSVTADNGNFTIKLQSDIPKDGLVRLHIVKDGYRPSDEMTTQTDTLIIQLRKK
jgi:hypothetical protein